MNAPRPCVLWVDDDAAIRHFVTLALEDEPIELRLCDSVAQAREVLAQGPVALLVTDLMMPGETGFDLLAGPLPVRSVVFSARLDEATRQQLAALGVWRHLPKPASVADLLDCVRSGVASAAPPLPCPEDSRRERATAHSFAGNQALFERFEAACREQFLLDREAGDAAAARGDLSSLRLLGHSLASVLRMLGHEAQAQQAQALESAAGLAAACQAWAALRGRLPCPAA